MKAYVSLLKTLDSPPIPCNHPLILVTSNIVKVNLTSLICERNGLAILAANPKNKGEFYAINNRGLFCSTDTGLVWRELDVSWSKEYLSQHPWALAVKGQD